MANPTCNEPILDVHTRQPGFQDFVQVPRPNHHQFPRRESIFCIPFTRMLAAWRCFIDGCTVLCENDDDSDFDDLEELNDE